MCMVIWVVSDGKPGHLNQMRGLVSALKQRTKVEEYEISLQGLPFWRSWWRGCKTSLPKPDLILGAGHKTHIPLLLAAKKQKAISCLCMSPSLPLGLFDVCFLPYHDLEPRSEMLAQRYPEFRARKGLPVNVFATMGPLHAIVPQPEVEKTHSLLLIGGPSKYYSWDTDLLVQQIRYIEARSSLPLVATTSRRTPKGVVERLRKEFPRVNIVAVEDTDKDWVKNHLASAGSVWVSEDSVSMIFEAVGAGVFVGLLAVPRRQVGSPRVAAGIKLLISEGFVTPFKTWKRQGAQEKTPLVKPLLEARRAADFLLARYPYLLSSVHE